MTTMENGTGTKGPVQPTCYNCGGFDHYMMSCPEPTRQVPAGLVAARAAGLAGKSLTTSQTMQNAQPPTSNAAGQPGQDVRPLKRQRVDTPNVTYPFTASPAPNGHYTAPVPPHAQMPAASPYGQATPAYQPQHYTQPPPYSHQPQSFPQYSAPYGSQSGAYGQPPYQPGYAQPTYGQYPPQAATHTHGGPYPQPAYQPQGSYQQPGPPYSTPTSYQQPGQYGPQGPQYPVQSYGSQWPQNGMPQAPYGPNGMHNHGRPQPNSSFHSPHQQQPPFNAAFQRPPQWISQNQNTFHGPHPQQPQQALPHQARQSPIPNATPSVRSQASPTPLPNQPLQAPQRTASVASSNNGTAQSMELESPKEPMTEEEERWHWDSNTIFLEKALAPATPMAYPLPGIWHGDKIPPPANGTTGLTSRYVRMASREVWSKSITESLQWETLKNDPAFEELDWEAPSVLIEEMRGYVLQDRLVADVQETAPATPAPQETKVEHTAMAQQAESTSLRKRSRSDMQEDVDEQIRSEAVSGLEVISTAQPSHQASEDREHTPAFEDSNDPWAPQAGEAAEPKREVDPTEALLASLGVTGSPKPVSQSRDAVPRSANGTHPTREDSGYGSTKRSFSRDEGATNRQDGNRRRSAHDITPPPPPPPAHLRQHTEPSSPISEVTDLQSPWAKTEMEEEQEHNPDDSPLSPTSAELLGDLGNGKKSRRDNTMSRMKRRQPKVESAYSRRW